MPTAPAVTSTRCSGTFCGDRDLTLSELVDNEHYLARVLASVRQLLHLALEQAHEKGRQLERLREQHRSLRDEYRRHRERVLHDEHAGRRPAA